MDNLEEYEQFAKELAISSGNMISKSYSRDNLLIETKANHLDLVTEIDRSVEKYIFDEIRKRYPDHCLIGEESLTKSKKLDKDLPTWIVDPIDGTMNFVHHSLYCCVSIGLAINQQLVMGVINAPFLQKLYSATKGNGARCNGIPIHVSSNVDRIEDALLICELKFEKVPYIHIGEKLFHNLLWRCQGVRTVGSACINLCMVAEGSADVYYQTGLRIWDMSAGYVIVTEAGGIVLNHDGQTFDPNSFSILAAANRKLTDDVAKIVSENLTKF